jgi:hypothetical protein
MFIFEALTVFVWIAFIVNGYRAGGVETLGRVIGSILGYLIARSQSAALIGLFSFILPKAWAGIVAFLAIFLIINSAIGLLFKIAGRLLHIFTRLPVLKQIDSLIGGFLGFIEGIIVIGGMSWLITDALRINGASGADQGWATGIIENLFHALFLNIL